MLGMKEERKFPNLQLTNASQLNDPFDCHPKLIDYSNVPASKLQGWIPEEWWKEKEEIDALNRRNNTWLCSLSKINDSILQYLCGVTIAIITKVFVSDLTWTKW